MIGFTEYRTKFPKCTLCGIMYTAASLEDGICVPCRSDRTIKKINLVSVLFWLAVIFFLCFMAAFSSQASTGIDLSWHRCYKVGDWQETAYCTAAAQESPNV